MMVFPACNYNEISTRNVCEKFILVFCSFFVFAVYFVNKKC